MSFEWPYFDDGDRPPTLVEWAEEFCDRYEFRLGEITLRSTPQIGFSFSIEEFEIDVERPRIIAKIGKADPSNELANTQPDIIGMRGPGKIRFSQIVHGGENYATYSDRMTVKGSITYDS